MSQAPQSQTSATRRHGLLSALTALAVIASFVVSPALAAKTKPSSKPKKKPPVVADDAINARENKHIADDIAGRKKLPADLADDIIKQKGKPKPKPGSLADDAAKAKPKPGTLADDLAKKKAMADDAAKASQRQNTLVDDAIKRTDPGSASKAPGSKALEGGVAAPGKTTSVAPAPKLTQGIADDLQKAIDKNVQPGAKKNAKSWADDYIQREIQRIDAKHRKLAHEPGHVTQQKKPLVADDAAAARDGKHLVDEAAASRRKGLTDDVAKKGKLELKDLPITKAQREQLKKLADDAVKEYESRLLKNLRSEAAEDALLREIRKRPSN